MHLKLDTSGGIDDGDVARDLGQDTADIVVLSAADSDLAAFGIAYAGMPDGFPTAGLAVLDFDGASAGWKLVDFVHD